MLAKVVFPTPGGPQKIMDGITPDSMALRSTAVFPMRCSWPMYSSSELGRKRSANGVDIGGESIVEMQINNKN
jgi:hypothetical protein